MITCMGLMVGALESNSRDDLARQCLKFAKQYKMLERGLRPEFEVNRTPILCLQDWFEEDGEIFGLFKFTDSRHSIVTIPA